MTKYLKIFNFVTHYYKKHKFYSNTYKTNLGNESLYETLTLKNLCIQMSDFKCLCLCTKHL